MTVQGYMITTLRDYMSAVVAPEDGYPVIDLDVDYSSRSPVDVQLYVSSPIKDEADNSPNGDVGYVLVDRNVDDSSNTLGFIAINKDDNESYEKPQQAVGSAFSGAQYDVNQRPSVEVCNISGWHAYYFFVTFIGEQ